MIMDVQYLPTEFWCPLFGYEMHKYFIVFIKESNIKIKILQYLNITMYKVVCQTILLSLTVCSALKYYVGFTGHQIILVSTNCITNYITSFNVWPMTIQEWCFLVVYLLFFTMLKDFEFRFHYIWRNFLSCISGICAFRCPQAQIYKPY